MKRALCLVLGLMLVCGVVFAAVGIRGGSDGSPIGVATDIYFNTGFSGSTFDGSIYTVNQTVGAVALVTSGTIDGATINSSSVGVSTPAAGKFTTLTATGVITDVALYSKGSAVYPVHLAKVGADGSLYGGGTGTALKELGMVTATAGVGAGRLLCLSTTDGAIYSIGAGSCY